MLDESCSSSEDCSESSSGGDDVPDVARYLFIFFEGGEKSLPSLLLVAELLFLAELISVGVSVRSPVRPSPGPWRGPRPGRGASPTGGTGGVLEGGTATDTTTEASSAHSEGRPCPRVAGTAADAADVSEAVPPPILSSLPLSFSPHMMRRIEGTCRNPTIGTRSTLPSFQARVPIESTTVASKFRRGDRNPENRRGMYVEDIIIYGKHA